MRRHWLFVFVVLLLALAPASVAAQDAGESGDDVLIRINGPIDVAAGETVDNVIVISDNVTVDGNVTESLVVVDGNATVAGTVDGDVVVISGEIELLDGALITGDLNLYDSDLVKADGSTVQGSTNDRSAITWSSWDTFAVSAFLWVSVTLLSIVTALLFAAVGGRQMVTSARFITERTGATVIAAVVGGFLIPAAAIFAFFSVFGIGVGLALLLLLMPLMAVLGYIVAGTRIGLAIVGRNRPLAEFEHPYLGAVVGVVLLHLVGLIPFFGGIIQFLAAVVGAGALTLLAWDAWRGGRGEQVEDRSYVGTEQPSPAS
ncbi:MAG: polymer-forming cytoskeletal protein [Thermomicrobiales bacterium]